MSSRKILANLTPLFAVITLPLALLAAIFYGWTSMFVILIIGWFLLTPVSAILFSHPGNPGTGSYGFEHEIEEIVEERVKKGIRKNVGKDDHPSTDPIEELRERYARGEIDDVELEHRLDTLLEMDDVDSADEENIERVKATLDTDSARVIRSDTDDAPVTETSNH